MTSGENAPSADQHIKSWEWARIEIRRVPREQPLQTPRIIAHRDESPVIKT